MFNFFRGNKTKEVAEKVYERGVEIAVKNKTLSLLEELYQASVLTLTPEQMAQKLSNIIRKDLNLEFAGVEVFDKQADTLTPLAFSRSQRLVKTLYDLGLVAKGTVISNISKNDFFGQVIAKKQEMVTNNPEDLWRYTVDPEDIPKLKTYSHIKTLLLYPLAKGEEVMGVLMLGLNRDYQTLNPFEKASIKSCINVIALLLDKAYLYTQLQDSLAVEKQAKEELEKLDKIKNQFLAQTQHDLRTPLGIIRNYCDLLIDGTFGKQPKKAEDVIKRIQVVAENKIKDVNNFLDTTQFQLGKKVVSLKPGVELNPILNEIMRDLEFQAKAKKIYLTLKKPHESLVIEADREKLKAALFNIIDNSIKYTLQGGVAVEVSDGESIKIIVKDTGIGIKKEKIATLFDTAFERSEEAKKASPTGKGIGLYLSSQIIKAHNGKVWVESQGDGKGSTFHIELPVKSEPVKA